MSRNQPLRGTSLFVLLLATLLAFVSSTIGRGARAQSPSTTASTTAPALPLEFAGAAEPSTAPEIYGQGVRETSWRSPADEMAGFHLPPGFQANLYASEPEIEKPLNMNWGPKGRLWVTSTVEYPYPAADPAKARDGVVILSDSDGDGAADQATTFASGLNIAMGILPMHDGAIAFSIPNIVYLRDTDGDDQCDAVETLYGPFDTTRDTHGMINSMRLGMDGWIYACHGFNNQSEVMGSDGHSVKLHSGNTFRFRPDGSSIEHYTRGQVNPFGLTRDEWGNWYSADCHSKPLTALIQGACYPSFGRPHDGLGFAPDMMQHLHGSTAISGLAYYRSAAFPEPYRNIFYSGNVMTSRINCNALRWNGAKAVAEELPDFLTSDDPWFRPVDIQVGPDGALYVADFYNKIIGHYEVPLEHPGRDRTSGRIWRITYAGAGGEKVPGGIAFDDWRENLRSGNQTTRLLAARNADKNIRLLRESETDSAAEAIQEVDSILEDIQQPTGSRIAALQALSLSQELTVARAAQLIQDGDAVLATHAARIAVELWDTPDSSILLALRHAAKSQVPQLRSAAIGCLGRVGDATDCMMTMDLYCQDQDPTTRHVALVATRELLIQSPILDQVQRQLTAKSARTTAFAAALKGLDTAEGANRLLRFALEPANFDSDGTPNRELLGDALDLAIERADRVEAELLVDAIRILDEPAAQRVQRLRQAAEKLSGTGGNERQFKPLREARASLLEHLVEKCEQLLRELGAPIAWVPQNKDMRNETAADWAAQSRNRPNGTPVELRSSHTLGEQYTGSITSGPFACPDRLTFRMAGHNGFPAEDDHRKNFIQLIDAITGREIRRATPRRSDIAAPFHWDLASEVGRQVRMRIVDGDSAGAYAWIAAGEFSVGELNESPLTGSFDALVNCIAITMGGDAASRQQSSSVEQLERFRELGIRLGLRDNARLIHAAAIASGRKALASVANRAIKNDRSDLLEWTAFGSSDSEGRLSHAASQRGQGFAIASELSKSLPAFQQQLFAKDLASSAAGCEMLAQLLDSGAIAEDAVRGLPEIMPKGLSEATAKRIRLARQRAVDSPRAAEPLLERIERLASADTDQVAGQEMFATHCASCHQLGGKGALIGPQLDGAAARSFERLAEDILLPSRNVDRAFRTSSLLLDDDSVVTGLVVETESGDVEVTMQDGRKRRVASESIVDRKDSETSLMPGNLAELMNDQQLASVIRYLKNAATKTKQ